MFGMQNVVEAVSDMARRDRSKYHLTLGTLISALRHADMTLPVVFDNGSNVGLLHGDRGFYADLAFNSNITPLSVSAVLVDAEAAVGKNFEGYKGGDFIMDEKTPLWAAEYGNTGPAVVSVRIESDRVILVTKDLDAD